jgi:ribonuclease P protein component
MNFGGSYILGPMDDQRFPKNLRLRSRGDFRRVYDRRASVSDGLVRLVGCLNELPYPRIGLSVSRQVGNAVVRNRWKRLLREAFRLSRQDMPEGLDFVVIPRDGAKPELKALRKSLVDLSWRLFKRLKRDESTARRNDQEESRAKAQRRKEDE